MIDGAVVVERDGLTFARNDLPGAVFGEMAALPGTSTTAPVRVTRSARSLVADDALGFLGEHPTLTIGMSRTLASRPDGIVESPAGVKRQYADQVGHLAMADEILKALVPEQPVDVGQPVDADLRRRGGARQAARLLSAPAGPTGREGSDRARTA